MAELLEELQETEGAEVIDDGAADELIVAPIQYDITSYGADYDVEGLVKRINREDILIPPFQRNYVWNQQEASRFIESLLLGLPVPAIFLAKETGSNKLLVIDGQQRLKTLQFFYNGFFNPHNENIKQQVFKLVKVQPKFEGLTYQELDEDDKVKLNDSLIHAIIVKQESPENDNTSVYHIFDRLNSEGRRLTPQEIRTAIDHGKFIDLIKDLNEYENWRSIYGKKNSRLKDQELILRFLALYFDHNQYQKPMREFLNKFSQKHRGADEIFLSTVKKVFTTTVDVALKSLGNKAFRLEAGINAAIFDSMMVGIAHRINKGPVNNYDGVKAAYFKLLVDIEYLKLISQATSDESNISARLKMAIDIFDNI